MKLALTEVYEVATFYAHFDVVKEGETPPPAVTVRVCDSLSCAMAGAEHLLQDLPNTLGPDVRVVRAPCMGACDRAPVCAVGHVQVMQATTDSIESRASRTAPHAHAYPTDTPISTPMSAPAAMRCSSRCISGKRTRDEIIKIVSDAGLRGLGGAGFPTGRKWSLVRAEPAPRLMAVNADEGEPGTFKDRHYLERDPHRFIEGHADRRLGGRGAGHLHLYPRRVSRSAADAGRRDRQGRRRRACQAHQAFICAAAPAPTSAAKNPR